MSGERWFRWKYVKKWWTLWRLSYINILIRLGREHWTGLTIKITAWNCGLFGWWLNKKWQTGYIPPSKFPSVSPFGLVVKHSDGKQMMSAFDSPSADLFLQKLILSQCICCWAGSPLTWSGCSLATNTYVAILTLFQFTSTWKKGKEYNVWYHRIEQKWKGK